MRSFLLKALPHAVAVILFLVIASNFFSLLSDDYELKQSDIQHVMGMSKELMDYRMVNHEEALWSDNMFGGMPGYQTNILYPSNLLKPLDQILKLGTSAPVGTLFMCMLGFYIFMLCMRVNPWLGIVGAISFGLSTINILYLGGGHTSKVNAISYMAPALGGLVLAYRGRWLLGSGVFALFFGLHLASNHLQMTYYFAFLMGAVAITEVVRLLYKKEINVALKTSAAILVAAVLGVLPNVGNLFTTYEYGEYTTRGKTELTLPVPGKEIQETPGSGLRDSYILEYNMAAGEPWSMVIPNAKGGSSQTALGKNKEAIQKAPKQIREQLNSFAQYWGEQGSSAGAFYFGAAMMFLFVMALIFSKDVLRWPFLLLTVLAIFLSMRDMHALNNFFIHHFPMYNKFRDSKMMLVLIQFMAPALGMIFLDQLLKSGVAPAARKYLWIGSGALVALMLLLMVAPQMTGPFISTNEVDYLDSVRDQYKGDAKTMLLISDLEDAVVNVRHYIFEKDAQRSLLIMLVAVALVVVASFGKLKWYIAAGILALVVTGDMWSVSSRYLNEDKRTNPQTEKMEYISYSKKDEKVIPYEPDNCDSFILEKEKKSVVGFDEKVAELKDGMSKEELFRRVKSKERLDYYAEYGVLQLNTDYRVLLTSGSVFSEASMPFFHKSLGGYHGAKLKRYQEMIDFYLLGEIASINEALQTRSITAVDSALKTCTALNMLNTRYIKYSGQGPPIQNDSNALGNAWFVSDLRFVPSADEEMKSISGLAARNSAVVHDEFKNVAHSASGIDSSATVSLTEYATKRLTYKSKSAVEAPVIFSEVYYPAGWICRIDGNEVPIFRANYILRGAMVPAGEHTIEMSFEPRSYSLGNSINWIGSFALLILVLLIFGWYLRQEIASYRVS